jgi:hypothetical protein
MMPETMRLPVLGLLGDALRDVFGNLGGLARIAWPYYALATASAILGFALTGGSAVAETVAAVLGPGTASILTALAVLACTVKWQRHVVLAEPLSGIAPLNGRVLRYFLWSVLVSLLCALPILAGLALAFALGLLGADPTGETAFRIGPAGILVCVATGLVGFLLILRLVLVLPAVSVDDRSVTLRRSWQLTEGNALRLLAALLLLGLGLAMLGALLGLVQAALESGASDSGQLVPLTTGIGLQAAVNLLASMAAASLVARAYRMLASGAG